MKHSILPPQGRRWLVALLLASLSLNAYLLWPGAGGPATGTPSALLQRTLSEAPPSTANDSGLTDEVAEPTDLVRELQWLFSQADYDAALAGLSVLGPAVAVELRSDWLARCMAWIVAQDELESSRAFVQAGLRLDASDIDFRQLQAEIYLAEGKVIEAVDLLYALLRESDDALQGVFVSRLQSLFKAEVERLAELKAWQPLASLAERMLWHEPGHPPYSLVHSRALLKLEHYSQARAGLLAITADPYYGAQARELLDEIDRKSQGGEQIQLRTLGAHHVVQASLNGNASIDLMIDTGASYSVVDQNFLQALQQQRQIQPEPVFVRKAKISTAGGVIQADVYRFASLALGGSSVSNIELVVTPLETMTGSHGLLGMNFLQHFDFVIDQKYQLLNLSPRK